MQTSVFREFITLASELNFTKAAAKLHITQSTLSKHIKELEKETGLQLLNHSVSNPRLTAAGKKFLESAGYIVSEYDAAVQHCLEIQNQQFFSLVFQDASLSSAQATLYSLVKQYELQHIGCVFDFNDIWQYDRYDDALNDGVIDVAIDIRFLMGDCDSYLRERASAGFRVVVLDSEPCWVWFMKGSSFDRVRELTPDNIADFPIMAASGAAYDSMRKSVVDLVEKLGKTPRLHVVNFSSRATRSKYFLSDFGDALLYGTRGLANDGRIASRNDISSYEVTHPSLQPTLSFVARKDKTAAESFLDLAETAICR